jgi:aminomethyltransferase
LPVSDFSEEETAKHTPIEPVHRELGAKFTRFAGWLLPLRYPSGEISEHLATRRSVGIFDVSHLGRLIVRGPHSFELLQSFLSNDLNKIRVGRCQYSLVLSEDGTVVDDVIVWWLDRDRFCVLPNASNTAEVRGRLLDHKERFGYDASIDDITSDTALIAVQGPAWREAAKEAGFPEDALPARMQVLENSTFMIAGTGYTGEPGCEVALEADAAAEWFEKLVKGAQGIGGLPAGLGARDSLRLEMGYLLHGSDMDSSVSPYDVGLGWAVAMSKPDFVGKQALEMRGKAGPRFEIKGLVTSGRRAIPRAGYRVVVGSDPRTSDTSAREPSAEGVITSGGYSPCREAGIALVRFPRPTDGTLLGGGQSSEVYVDVRGRWEQARLEEPPFVDTALTK